MTDMTPVHLDDEDGALIFRADGSYEMRWGKRAKQLLEAPDHLVLMIGIHSLLDVEEFREDVQALVDDAVIEEHRREKAWSN